MELIHLTQHLVPCVGDITSWVDWGQQGWMGHGSIDWNLLAQLETDVFRPTREFFNNFIRSGQAWALLIGIILGYLLRSLTSYG